MSPVYADCISRCQAQQECKLHKDRMTPERYGRPAIFVKEIKRVPCQMTKALTFVTQERALRKIERPGEVAHVVQIHENSPLTAYVRGHARRMSNPLRIAPEPLYLQNLILLI
jgi:hypothetical protein